MPGTPVRTFSTPPAGGSLTVKTGFVTECELRGSHTASLIFRMPYFDYLRNRHHGGALVTNSSEIVNFLADRISGRREADPCEIDGQAALSPGRRGCISFASRDDAPTQAAGRNSESSVLLVLPKYLGSAPSEATVLAVESPRLEFARVVTHFFAPPRRPGVHPSAVVDPSARLGDDPQIGAGVVVGAKCRIGDRVTIGPNAVIHDGCVIGDDVAIGPCSVLGYTGFGYAREADGTPVLVPHLGSVTIGDRVEIGANTAIDRGDARQHGHRK